MKSPIKAGALTLLTLGIAIVAVPVIAQQTPMQDRNMQHGTMTDGHMGKMMGGSGSYAMTAFDTNRDGTLSPAEMTRGIAGEFRLYDTNKNGLLSQREFGVMHSAHMRMMTQQAFEMHDTDNNGQVTQAEMSAMATMMPTPMTAPHEGMPSMGMGKMKGKMGNN